MRKMKESIIIVLCVITLLLIAPGNVYGYTYGEYLKIKASVRFLSLIGDMDWDFEKQHIDFAWDEYLREHGAININLVGQALKDDNYPVKLYNASDQPITERLTFQYIDTTMRTLVSAGSEVQAVLYEVNKNPVPEDETGIIEFLNNFETIGTSYDSGNNFAWDYTFLSDEVFEPVIRATPLGADMQPIVIEGLDGWNVAVGYSTNILVPEPTTLCLLALGGLALRLRKC